MDSSRPLLLGALVDNENLKTVVVTFMSNGQPAGTTTLTNASISDYVLHGTTETWSFTYEKITWTVGGITAQDDWETPVGP
jgi:type VI protein secretion system component Hcp